MEGHVGDSSEKIEQRGVANCKSEKEGLAVAERAVSNSVE